MFLAVRGEPEPETLDEIREHFAKQPRRASVPRRTNGVTARAPLHLAFAESLANPDRHTHKSRRLFPSQRLTLHNPVQYCPNLVAGLRGPEGTAVRPWRRARPPWPRPAVAPPHRSPRAAPCSHARAEVAPHWGPRRRIEAAQLEATHVLGKATDSVLFNLECL